MADKVPSRLDSLSRRTPAAAAPKPGLKFKPKVVARRTKEERDASAPQDRPDAPAPKPRATRGNAARGGRGGMRGGRAMQGTHLVQAGPLASGNALNESTQGRGGVSRGATPTYMSHLMKSDGSRETTPGLSDDEDDLGRIDMSKEYKFSREESELFPVRAVRLAHVETENEPRSTPGKDLDGDVQIKDEPADSDLNSVLRQKDDELHQKLNQLELKTTDIAEDAVDDVDNSEKLLNDHKTIVQHILDFDNNDDKYLFFQLPRILPEFKDPNTPTSPAEVKTEPAKPRSSKSTEPEEKVPKLAVEGQVGKLRVHKSGKVTMKIGDVIMEVGRGSTTDFLQNVVMVNTEEKTASLLGHIEDKIVVTPKFV